MKLEISIQQLLVLEHLISMLKGISTYSTVSTHIETDGWFGKGTADFNRHEHNAKIRIEVEP